MSCENGLTEQDIERASENIKAVNDWAEGDETNVATMANGREVPSPAKVIADGKMFKEPIAWAPALNVTDALQTYENGGFLYAPIPSALPFTTGAVFDGSKWYTIQSIVFSGGAIDFQGGKGVNVSDGTDPTDVTSLQQVEAADAQVAADAETYADAGDAAVTAAAEADATAKANAAETNANNYTDGQVATVTSVLPLDSRFGCELNNIGAGLPNDVIVSAGRRRSSDDTVNMILTTQLEKNMSANFTVGDGNGGRALADPLAADTEYNFYLISTADGLTCDLIMATSEANALADPNAVGASLVKARRIGKAKTKGGVPEFRLFEQFGDDFMFADMPISGQNTIGVIYGRTALEAIPANTIAFVTASMICTNMAGLPVFVGSVTSGYPFQINNTSGIGAYQFQFTAVNQRIGLGLRLKTDADSRIGHSLSGGAGIAVDAIFNATGWKDSRLD